MNLFKNKRIMAVVAHPDDELVPAAHQPADHVRSHPAQSDHTELHLGLLRFNRLVRASARSLPGLSAPQFCPRPYRIKRSTVYPAALPQRRNPLVWERGRPLIHRYRVGLVK